MRATVKIAARLLLPLLGTALVACSSSMTTEAEANIPPTDYKREILVTLTSTLGDPTNLRDAFISDPVLTPLAGGEQRYTVCVRFNARDERRVYVGSRDRIAYFYGGHLNQLVEASKEQCGNATYRAFPEAEKLCHANQCK
jgi:hypothetical protein